jgi:hypothetical protein
MEHGIYKRSVPKVMRMILNNFFLLNIHAITVYPLQNRLLVIEYSNSSISESIQENHQETIQTFYCVK